MRGVSATSVGNPERPWRFELTAGSITIFAHTLPCRAARTSGITPWRTAEVLNYGHGGKGGGGSRDVVAGTSKVHAIKYNFVNIFYAHLWITSPAEPARLYPAN